MEAHILAKLILSALVASLLIAVMLIPESRNALLSLFIRPQSSTASSAVISSKTELDTFGVPWTEKSVTVRGCTFFFYQTTPSTDLPILVFLQGGGPLANGASDIPFMSPLSNKYQIVLPSARGYGKSTKQDPQIPATTLTMVEDLAALIPAVFPGEKVFLIGHSMGATVAPRVAKLYPGLVRGLALEDPAWLVLEGEPVIDPPEMIFQGPAPGTDQSYPFQEDNEKGKSSGPGGHQGPGVPPGSVKGKGLGDDVSNQAVAGVTVPTLIITGGPEAHCKKDVLTETIKTYSTVKEVNFPQAGHDIHDWYPNEWRKAVNSFFDDVIQGKV